MRVIFSAFLSLSSLAFAGRADEAPATPSIIARMVQGLADSRIDGLVSKVSTYDGKEYSYYLKTIDYLGTVKRDGRRYTVAAAKFIRSSPSGSQYPPAKGHGYLLVFNDAYRVVTHGRMDYGDYHMEGEVLKSSQTTIANFGATDPATRHQGWLLDSAFMPYPFADRISDADWYSGAGRKKP